MVLLLLILLNLVSTITHGMTCYPAENFWHLTEDICDKIPAPSLFSAVDEMLSCLVGTPITQADIPYPITTPGNYYLCESITNGSPAAIIIASDNVYLNLNGHTITTTGSNLGIQCSNHQNVQIVNGSIQQSLFGIELLTTNSITIRDINISLCKVGIFCTDTTNITIENCLIKNTTVSGILVNGISDSVFIKNSTVLTSAQSFDIENISPLITNIILDSCIANEFTSSGFQMRVDGAILRNCAAINGSLNSDGFFAINSTHVDFINCIVSNCLGASLGFVFTGSNNILCKNCSVTACQTGFFIGLVSSFVTIDQCVASENSGSGINNAASSPTVFIVDTRSQHGATTTNPAYQLNGAPDIPGTATIIVTS